MWCTEHPTREAHWLCSQCGAHLCDDCPRSVGLSAHRVCPKCGSAISTFAPQRSLEQVFARSLRRAFSGEGLLTALALGVFYGTLNWLWVIPIIFLGTLVSYYFVTIHHVGGGGEGLPTAGEAIQNWGELRAFAFGGLFCVGLGLLPLILAGTLATEPLPPRIAWTLLLVAQLYMPAIVLSIAVTNSAWAAIWPPTWIRVIARAPGAYVRFVAMWVASVAIGTGIALGTSGLGEGWIIDSVRASGWTLFWLFQASIVGEYIRSNAAAFGWD